MFVFLFLYFEKICSFVVVNEKKMLCGILFFYGEKDGCGQSTEQWRCWLKLGSRVVVLD